MTFSPIYSSPLADVLKFISSIPIKVNPNLPAEKWMFEWNPAFGKERGTCIALEQKGMVIGWIELTAPQRLGGKVSKLVVSQEYGDHLCQQLEDRDKGLMHG